MSKPMRNAIAIVLRSANQPGKYLAIKRPDEGGDLDGFWGLPATRMRPGELPEDAARRVCREKLGCDAVPLGMIGTMFQERNSYDMFFMDIEMLLVGNAQPDVTQAHTTSTVYVKQRWTNSAKLLLPAAKHGSCCSTIFLTSQGFLKREQWVTSLQGSTIVK